MDNTTQFYFVTNGARSYSCRGPSGQMYEFSARKATRVERQDADRFRQSAQLLECKADGSLVDPKPTPKPKPISYTKFDPSNQVRKTTHNVR